MRTFEHRRLMKTYLEHPIEAKDILKRFVRIIPFQNLICNRLRSYFVVGILPWEGGGVYVLDGKTHSRKSHLLEIIIEFFYIANTYDRIDTVYKRRH